MADYLATANPPLPIEAEPPFLKILDFGNGALLFTILADVIYLGFSAYQQGEARPPTQSAIKVRPPEIVFPMVALGDNDPNWDLRGDIWSLACTVGLFWSCRFIN